MGEVPAVSKEMATPLHSLLDWTSRFFGFVRARAHVLFDSLILYSFCRLLSCSFGIVVCLELIGAVYETSGLRY